LLVSALTSRLLALPDEPPVPGTVVPPVEPPVEPEPPEFGRLPPLGRLPGVNDGWNDVDAELASVVPDGAVSRPSHTPKLPAATTPRVSAVTPRLFQFRRGRGARGGLTTFTALSGTLGSVTTFSSHLHMGHCTRFLRQRLIFVRSFLL
jgi:hypothetical protein